MHQIFDVFRFYIHLVFFYVINLRLLQFVQKHQILDIITQNIYHLLWNSLFLRKCNRDQYITDKSVREKILKVKIKKNRPDITCKAICVISEQIFFNSKAPVGKDIHYNIISILLALQTTNTLCFSFFMRMAAIHSV